MNKNYRHENINRKIYSNTADVIRAKNEGSKLKVFVIIFIMLGAIMMPAGLIYGGIWSKKRIINIVDAPALHSIFLDPEKAMILSVDKGFFAFGDIKLSTEESQTFESAAKLKLEAIAKDSESMYKAYEYAKYVLRDLFEGFVSTIDSSAKVEICFKNIN